MISIMADIWSDMIVWSHKSIEILLTNLFKVSWASSVLDLTTFSCRRDRSPRLAYLTISNIPEMRRLSIRFGWKDDITLSVPYLVSLLEGGYNRSQFLYHEGLGHIY